MIKLVGPLELCIRWVIVPALDMQDMAASGKKGIE